MDILNARVWDWARWRLTGHVNKLSHLLYWPNAPWRVEKKFRWQQIKSCNLAVWKSDFLKINGFDEVFEGWGHEDADMVLRLHHLGIDRQNGFCCTEVYHLWHRHNTRQNEGINHQRVLDRAKSGCVRAEKGALDHADQNGVVITDLASGG